MNQNIIKLTSIVAASLFVSALAVAHGKTLHLYTNNGAPAFGIKHEDGTIHGERAYAGTLAWNATRGAYTTSSPGWTWGDEWAATDFHGFKVLTSAQVWNGTTFVDAANDFKILLGTSSITTGSGVVNGFNTEIGTNDHLHIRYNLLGVENGAAGSEIYRLNFLGLRTTAAGATTEYPGFGLVLNRGGSAGDVAAALAYANANPVPEPATLAVLSLGAGFILRRRRQA
jgi:hypothetical protein